MHHGSLVGCSHRCNGAAHEYNLVDPADVSLVRCITGRVCVSIIESNRVRRCVCVRCVTPDYYAITCFCLQPTAAVLPKRLVCVAGDGSAESKGGAIEAAVADTGLFQKHAYSIVDIKVRRGRVLSYDSCTLTRAQSGNELTGLPSSALLRLRNPWGRGEWKGVRKRTRDVRPSASNKSVCAASTGRWSDGSTEVQSHSARLAELFSAVEHDIGAIQPVPCRRCLNGGWVCRRQNCCGS